MRFAELLEMVAAVNPDLRVRFSTSHPKDMTDDVLHAMSRHENICKYIHLPVQSGHSDVLKRMNRGYTREWYLDRIAAIRRIMPGCAISTDIITGFCGETQEEHEATLSLMDDVRYDMAFMFKYSERPKTLAERKFKDDIPEEVKSARLQEVIARQMVHGKRAHPGTCREGAPRLDRRHEQKARRSVFGRTTHNTVVVFPKGDLKPGQYVNVKTFDSTAVTLIGEVTDENAES